MMGVNIEVLPGYEARSVPGRVRRRVEQPTHGRLSALTTRIEDGEGSESDCD